MAEQNNNVIGLMWEVRNNHNELTVLAVTISSLILAIVWYKFKLSNGAQVPLPPGPRSFPIVGFLPFVTPDFHRQLTNMAHTYGPIFKFKLGTKLHVVINTPELVKVVVRDQDEAFSDRDQPIAALSMSYGGQDIIFSKNNENWRKLRKISVHEMLSNKSLLATASVRREEVRKAVKNVFGKIGTKVNIRDIVFATETSLLTRTIWQGKGVENNKLAAEIDAVASNMIHILGRVNLSDLFPILAWFDLQGVVRDMEKQRDRLDQLFDRIIEDRIESNLKNSHDEGEKDFLQILLNYKDEKDGTPLNTIQIKSLLMVRFIINKICQ
ncbi:hypothetical protein M8C21_007646 [Ambrosia artemisiifolia]|uniref:Cytochrome P450 n=1 Tax=Ambrosia artemisiifolia TaxID=4212 RepID=A0AAD5G8E0_AMBAR|nr:hypothetical protein M8C21_007646 [Ambrosia artemisiifolia]